MGNTFAWVWFLSERRKNSSRWGDGKGREINTPALLGHRLQSDALSRQHMAHKYKLAFPAELSAVAHAAHFHPRVIFRLRYPAGIGSPRTVVHRRWSSH